MKNILVIHNPGSGDENHTREELLELFGGYGEVSYVSTEKEGWEESCGSGAETIFIAGGDGTVRKVARWLIGNQQPHQQLPQLGLLPLGTANNIAETLGLPSKESASEPDPFKELIPFDIGRIKGLSQENFFMESVGAGIFPELLSKDEEVEIEGKNPESEIINALKHLRKVTAKAEAGKAKIKADGIKITGRFLLVELLNIKFLGPNLPLAPQADPGDGYFDLVLVPENSRQELLNYLDKRIEGEERGNLDFLKTLRVQKFRMEWEGSQIHVDDELISDYGGGKIKIKMVPGALKFLR